MGKKMVAGPGRRELVIVKQKPPETTHFKISADPELVKRIGELARENTELKRWVGLLEARLEIHEPCFPGDFLKTIESGWKLLRGKGLDSKKGEK